VVEELWRRCEGKEPRKAQPVRSQGSARLASGVPLADINYQYSTETPQHSSGTAFECLEGAANHRGEFRATVSPHYTNFTR
jgi:hypothetical protein